MISTRLTTTGNAILSYKLGNLIQGVQSLIERRTANNKRFGKLEITIPQVIHPSGIITCNDDDEIKLEPRNIIAGFLLDTSGSMDGKKLQHAINTIKKFVEILHVERNGKTIQHQPIHAWIYVITFNSVAELVIPFQEITDQTLPVINQLLDQIHTSGSTNYEKAFKKQAEVIEDIMKKLDELHDAPQLPESVAGGRNPQHYHMIRFFETDGEITEGSSNIKRLYEMMRCNTPSSKVRITFEDCVLGYGTDVDLGCLKTLASPYPPGTATANTNTDTESNEVPVVGGRNPQQPESVVGGRNPQCSSLITILNPDDIGFKTGEFLFKLIMRYGFNVQVSVASTTADDAAAAAATVELFEYQTHQWGTTTTLHSMIHGEKKTLWVQYTPPVDAVPDAPLPPVQVKIQYENQFTAEKFTYQFEHEITAEQSFSSYSSSTPSADTAAETSIFDLVIPLFPLILGMAQIEILKMFREIEANRYDKDTIVREAYKILRMLKSINAITHISYPTISCQNLNLITDVKVIIGLTTIQNPKEQRMVIHDRRICSAEQEVFNSGAAISRKYVHDEEEYEEEAIRVINAAKTSSAATANPDDHDHEDEDLYEEVDDGLPSRIPTVPINTQNDYMDTPFPPSSHHRRRNNNTSNGSEVRALCVRIATARNKKEDTSAEELYQQMQRPRYGYYDPEEDAPCYYTGADDTFSSTPMDDEYTQRRVGMMRQMSAHK
jgi:hypothetical protein